jgi:subfamily B ATP-binding cassette protein MsbA
MEFTVSQTRNRKPNNFFRFLSYVRPHWKLVLFGAIGGVVKFTVPLLVPQVTRYLLDNVYLDPILTTEEKLTELFMYLGGMVAIFVFVWAPWTYARHYCTAKAGQKSVFDLRHDLYYRILRMSASFFERNLSGSIVSRLVSDIALAQNLVGSALTNVWMDAISIIVVLVFLIQIDAPATLVALSIMPVYVFFFKRFQGRIRDSSYQVQEKIAQMSGNVQEKIAGRVVIHAFTQEKREEQNFLRDAERLMSSSMRRAFYHSMNMTIMGVLTNVAPLLVTLFSGYRVIQGQMTVGELIAVTAYLGPLYMPVRRFSELNVVFANSTAALDRIFEIMDEKPEIRSKPNAVKLRQIRGEVAFEQVGFSYTNIPGTEQGPVLRDIDFTAEPGQKIALVGPSGSGKSTLVSLIPRFYDVQAGAVKVDGYDIRDLGVRSLRRHIGMVMQDSILFTGSVFENVLYGNPKASRKQVIEACKAANACEFIQTLPDGFDTEVGEGGTFLSGGQKQRLTIARAFLKSPRILILDEATSSLDSESEHLIQEALEHLMVERTTFIIAHRLSTIVNADRIFVLHEGQIIEDGTHAELLEQGDLYYDLYTQQFESAQTSWNITKPKQA